MPNIRIPTYLSDRDEYCGDKYIPITELFSDPKYCLPGMDKNSWGLGSAKIDEFRRMSFNAVKKRWNEDKRCKFSTYWNANIEAINQLGLNEFAKISWFRDLANVMAALQCDDKPIGKRKRHIVSFGIRLDLYRKYYKWRLQLVKCGSDAQFKKPVIRDMAVLTAKRYGTKMSEIVQIEKRDIAVKKDQIFLDFRQWCEERNYVIGEGLKAAMKLIMDVDPLKENRKYKYKATDIEQCVVKTEIQPSEDRSFHTRLPGELLEQMYQIIRLYNSDKENEFKPKLTSAAYVAQAIAYYNKRVPLKYSDPIAYEEYLTTKQQKDYNEKKEE